MLTIQKLDLSNRKQVHRFIEFPFHLYRNDPNWVPSLWLDMKTQISPRKNPFFEHSIADFFLAVQEGYGMLIDGFDQDTMVTMMNHNLPYYPVFMERL